MFFSSQKSNDINSYLPINQADILLHIKLFKSNIRKFVNMIRTKAIYLIVIALSSSMMLTSCFLFRGKNKCDTCPSFNHTKKKKKH